MYDTIIVGAGIAGCTIARALAENSDRKILLIDQRDQLGGNAHDGKDAHGVLIHPYGPHIYHTSDEDVHTFLSRFTQWRLFRHKVVARIGDQLVPVPFNLQSLRMTFPQEKAQRIEEKLVEAFGRGTRVPILTLMESEDEDLKEVGDFVYEHVFLHYTLKQWEMRPEDIDPAVTARVPVVIDEDDGYFHDTYQGVPQEGYTVMFEKMIDHPQITLCLGTPSEMVLAFDEPSKKIYISPKYWGEDADPDAMDGDAMPYRGEVIYTGALDELFDNCFGPLPYRSLDFVFEYTTDETYQGYPVVNYTESEDFTRIAEYKLLTGQEVEGSTVSKEYSKIYTPGPEQIPYYPINNPTTDELYARYRSLADGFENFYLLGRLAEYKYYNMDLMCRKAIELAAQILIRENVVPVN